MRSRAVQEESRIISNTKVSQAYWKLTIESASISNLAYPGAFVEVKLNVRQDDPLLRRPFSIHRIKGVAIEILYAVVGRGSKLLTEKKQGELLDIIGPLGRGFTLAKNQKAGSMNVLVAGGMGVAPLVFLAEQLSRQSARSGAVTKVLIGGRTKGEILCEKEFTRAGCEVAIATDDGSRGYKGYVTGLLAETLAGLHGAAKPVVYACGPLPMLKELSVICRKRHIPAQVSMEEHMSCGFGVCLGCVVKVKSAKPSDAAGFEYQRVCKEGPVFDSASIVW